MSASPSIATLQSLLRSSSINQASASSSNSRSSEARIDPSSTSNTSNTLSYASPSYWGSTLSGAFGYGSSTVKNDGIEGKRERVEGKGKGKARLSIPTSWNEEDEDSKERTAEEEKRDEESLGESTEVDFGNQELNDLVDSILWKVDADALPTSSGFAQTTLLVLACSRIPSPSPKISHPQILDKLRMRLERYASTGLYSIVLLANPTPNPPSTPQLVSSYLSLSRTSRKNLQKLWVVGGGWWTRVILTLFNTTLLSLKTTKKQKIVQCADLSSLAKELGTKSFTSVEFPLEVYIENAKVEKEIRLPEGDEKRNALFGVELDQLFHSSSSSFPPILEDCLSVLLTQGPTSLGIFRRSPSASTVQILSQAYSRSHPVSLHNYPDAPYIAASLLKLFLRELPTPILPKPVWEKSKECPSPNEPLLAVKYIREEILPLIGGREIEVLKRLMRVCKEIVEGEKENLMSSSNLVVCLAPALIGGVEMGGMMSESVETCRVPGMGVMSGTVRLEGGRGQKKGEGANTVGGVLKVMIERYDEIFEPSPSNSNPPSSPLPSSTTTQLVSPTFDRTLKRPTGGGGGGVTKTERTNVRGIFAGQDSVSEEEEQGGVKLE